MASVSRPLQRIKQDLEPFVPADSIVAACHEAGHRWRERKLGPVRTLHLFIIQVLWCNTAMTHLKWIGGVTVNAAAYCRARQRLPLTVLQSLLRSSSQAMRQGADGGAAGLWCGRRALLVDGSSSIVPDTPDAQQAFSQPKGCKQGCGFPVPKVLGLFDAFSGMILELLCFPLYTHEQSKVAAALHPLLRCGDVLIGDRGFCSFIHMALLAARGVDAVFRAHQRQIVDFRPGRRTRRGGERGRPSSRFIKRLGKCDQIVQWSKAKARPQWMTYQQYAELPEVLQVRELRYHIPRKGQRTLCVTIATTLLDPLLYPKEKIAELYNVRWSVETHFRELKITLKMRKLKSKSAIGARKELAVYALVYNLVHAVMLAAAARQGVTPDRISFIDALRWLWTVGPNETLAELATNPHRPGRHEPRVVKDREDTYTKMTRPRSELRKTLKTMRVAKAMAFVTRAVIAGGLKVTRNAR